MLRLVYLVIRFLFEIPFLIFQIKRYKKHPERYSLEERINWTRKLLRKATRRARVKLDISGTEYLPKEGGFLVTPNHQGLFDILALFDALDQPFKIVYKEELRKISLAADVLDNMEYHAISRKNLRQSMKVIRSTTKELKDGLPAVIFPEGTRSREGNHLLEFKGGSFKAAIDAKAPIVPCAMINCFKVLDYNSLKKVNCAIHFFEPVTYDEYKDLASTEIAEMVQERIQSYINEHD